MVDQRPPAECRGGRGGGRAQLRCWLGLGLGAIGGTALAQIREVLGIILDLPG